MPRKPTPKRDDPEESERFIKTAREVEADERPEVLERTFKKILQSGRVRPVPPKE